MDSVYQILEYLPLRYKNEADFNYFSFLAKSVEQNYNAGNFHFAVIALHMIYMGIVYHYIYGIYRADKTRFDCVLIGFHEKLKIKSNDDISWQTFSKENESVIFQFYRAVGIPNDLIGDLKSPVQTRNTYLHANGAYLDSSEGFEKLSIAYLRNLNKIDDFCMGEYKKLYFSFIDEIMIDVEDMEEASQYIDTDFIQEFGINNIILKELCKIKDSEYPDSKKIFYYAIKNMFDDDSAVNL